MEEVYKREAETNVEVTAKEEVLFGNALLLGASVAATPPLVIVKESERSRKGHQKKQSEEESNKEMNKGEAETNAEDQITSHEFTANEDVLLGHAMILGTSVRTTPPSVIVKESERSRKGDQKTPNGEESKEEVKAREAEKNDDVISKEEVLLGNALILGVSATATPPLVIVKESGVNEREAETSAEAQITSHEFTAEEEVLLQDSITPSITLFLFNIILPTIDTFLDIALVHKLFLNGYWGCGVSVTAGILTNFLFTSLAWWRLEPVKQKKWSWIFLVLQLWPQLRAFQVDAAGWIKLVVLFPGDVAARERRPTGGEGEGNIGTGGELLGVLSRSFAITLCYWLSGERQSWLP